MATIEQGSYLELPQGAHESLPPHLVQAGVDLLAQTAENAYPRSRAAVERFFDGLELVPPYAGAAPAVTYVGLWGAEDLAAADSAGSRAFYCVVARRP